MLLCVDAGFGHMGWSVFHEQKLIDCGCIKTKKTKIKQTRAADDRAHRAAVITRELLDVVKAWGPEGLVAELPSGGAKSARAMADMASATCLVSAVATVSNIPTEWYTPPMVKKAVTGKRNAGKSEIKLTVADALGIRVSGDRRKTYHVNLERITKQFPGGEWEDIADSIGAYWASKDGNLYRMFG